MTAYFKCLQEALKNVPADPVPEASLEDDEANDVSLYMLDCLFLDLCLEDAVSLPTTLVLGDVTWLHSSGS